MTTFQYPEDLRLDTKTHPKRPYERDVSFYKNQHFGQLKLFSNELEFILTFCCDENILSRKKVILYIGAGPGNHIVYLAKMFPSFEWHLFDLDSRFDERLDSIKNVFLEKRYFDDSSLEAYMELKEDPNIDLYLISDIRNLSYNSKKWSIDEELKLLDDMEFQKNWIVSLKPKYSMLKFRLPFPEKEVIKLLGGDTVEYLDGIIYKQPWSRGKSAESRLVIPGNNIRLVKYSLKDYEEQMSYHNVILRQEEYTYFMSESLNHYRVNKKFTINLRYDCAFIITLLHQYFKRNTPGMPDNKIRGRIIKVLDFVSLSGE